MMPRSDKKQAVVDRARSLRRVRRARRLERWRCFWSRPIGHRYLTPDGRTVSEVFAGGSTGGGARADLRCAACGRSFYLGEQDTPVSSPKSPPPPPPRYYPPPMRPMRRDPGI